ncbi:UMP kinase [Thermosphaera chiliense]|uniref:UMP kinase n=1 Tax=Thermosphaera chiliense TaxID=3402707 RepID=A0A7M1UTU8_9CREN|nr:UMP kinase [Thermosphaera aggregans]QOR95043.1 UMP kinase [Thermosphaera aggregans]
MIVLNTLVLKITGKAFDEGSGLIEKYVSILKTLSEKYKLIVITGGGRLARHYIDMAKNIGVTSNYWLDLIGIDVSRLNALLLIAGMEGRAYPKPYESLNELLSALPYSNVLVAGGLIPGQSTASVAVQSAEAVGARVLYYFSAIDYVYDKDPAKHSDAQPFKEITATRLKEILAQKQLPGEYALIDDKALDMAVRSGIEIRLIFFKNPEKIFESLNGLNPGTRILPK